MISPHPADVHSAKGLLRPQYLSSPLRALVGAMSISDVLHDHINVIAPLAGLSALVLVLSTLCIVIWLRRLRRRSTNSEGSWEPSVSVSLSLMSSRALPRESGSTIALPAFAAACTTLQFPSELESGLPHDLSAFHPCVRTITHPISSSYRTRPYHVFEGK